MKELQVDEKDLRRILIPDTPMARFWRRFRKLFRQLIAFAALYLLFFVLLNFGAYWARFEYSVNAKPVEKISVKPEPAPAVQYKPELQIPKLKVSAPLQIEVNPTILVEKLKTGVTHYANTAKPGQIGNSVIVGHSSDFPWSDGKYKNVFALLDKLVKGDQIIITYKTEKYIYEVSGSKVVSPYEVSVLRKTSSPTLTLLTCYPVGSTRSRLIVTAKLVSDNADTLQQSDPLTGESLPKPR